jgi:hypothetical protein
LKGSKLHSIYELNQLLIGINNNEGGKNEEDNTKSKLIDYEIFFIEEALENYRKLLMGK